MTMIVNYVQTEKLAVSTGGAVESTITNANYDLTLAVVSSAPFHALVIPDGVVAAVTTDSAYFPANTVHFLPLPANGVLHVLGTATTNLWVSSVTIAGD